jgi:hypothetical protein
MVHWNRMVHYCNWVTGESLVQEEILLVSSIDEAIERAGGMSWQMKKRPILNISGN